MATMVPSTPDVDTPTSETTVFSVFEQSLPKDWLVIHSRRLLLPPNDRSGSYEGESDFLLFHPRRGLIALEVKGGQYVGRDRNGWFSIDRYDKRHSIKDPGQQAQQFVHRLSSYLREQRWFATNDCHIPFAFGVVVPDFRVNGGLDPSLPREIVLDQEDMKEPQAALRRLCDARGLSDRPLPQGAWAALLDVVAPIVKLVPSLSGQIDREARDLVRLTKEQARLLDMLRKQRRVAVEGVAGSGKTLIAMEKAERLVKDGKKVLFLCFNRPLAEHLNKRATGFQVKTFHALCREMAAGAGVEFKIPVDPKEKSSFFDEVAPEKLMDAATILEDERFDAILIDEGQDFRELWWAAIEALLRDPTESLLYVFWDPNQDLYDRGPDSLSDMFTANLDRNCRNTVRIARFSGRFVNLDPEVVDTAPEGQAVEEYEVADDKALIQTVRKLLHKYVNEDKIAADRVVVLTPGSAESSPLWQQRKFGNLTLVDLQHEPGPGDVRLSSIKHFKGLEADVIILADVRPGSRSCGPRDLHVGSSRARHVLAVITRKD